MKLPKIERGIPVAPRRSCVPPTDKLLKSMGVGDSVLVQKAEANALRMSAYRLGLVTTQRKTEDGIRVWRIA